MCFRLIDKNTMIPHQPHARCCTSFCNPPLVVSTHTNKHDSGCLLCVLLVNFFWVFSDFRFTTPLFPSIQIFPLFWSVIRYIQENFDILKQKVNTRPVIFLVLILYYMFCLIFSWFRERLKHTLD